MPAPPTTVDVRPEAASPPGPDHFGQLQASVRAAGLLERSPVRAMLRVAVNLACYAAAWAVFVAVGDSWWQLAVAVLVALAFTQTGFVGHDIGHRQLTGGRRTQDLLGYLHGNLLLGFSYGWWVNHHNRHHAYPNHLERDSDITRRRVIFVPDQGPLRVGRAKQFIVRHQHVLFYALLSTEGIGLRVASTKALRRRELRRPLLEGSLIGLHLVAYVGALALVLPPAKAVAFVAVHQLAFGLHIGSVFAPNHKGMPIQRPADEWDWMTRQVVTSRNLRSNPVVAAVFGGLDSQIEHHLFPTMPRRHLRRARALTRAHCARAGLPYHEVAVHRSVMEILGHLRDTTRAYQAMADHPSMTRPARTAPPA